MTVDVANNTNRNRSIEWFLRILIALLFLVSALAKLYPSPYFALTTFEIKQLLPLGFSEELATWFSRTLIGIEFSLGILMLQPHFYKKLVLPATFLILLIFNGHLIYDIMTNGNQGNCGCFGALLPMTPLQAVIKNFIAMGILVVLYRMATVKNDKSNFWVLTSVTFGLIMLVFMVGMKPPATMNSDIIETVENVDDSSNLILELPKKDSIPVAKSQVDTVKVVKKEEPKQASSGYASVFPGIDKGRKVLCFFAPGCDHCKETAKELTKMRNQVKDFPEINIAFMDEEAELIPDFFTHAGRKYTNKLLDIATFWKTVGSRNTPVVFYLWNGNVIKEYDGIDAKAFNKAEFKKIIQTDYKDLKLK